MAGPWDDYAAPERGPWADYAPAAPAAAPKALPGAQPSIWDRIVASPVGRLAHDFVAPIAETAMHGPMSLVKAANTALPEASRAPENFGVEDAYQRVLERNRNTPGYQAAKADAARALSVGGESVFTDQMLAPIKPAANGLVGGLLGGSWDAANANADAQAEAQAAYAKKYPGRAFGAQVLGGALAAPAGGLKVPANAVAPSVKVPTVQELKSTATSAYKAVDDSTMKIAPTAIQGMVDNLTDALNKRGWNEKLMPKAAAALEDLKGAVNGPGTLQDLELRRRIAGIAAQSPDKADRAAARIIQDHIDDFAQGITPQQLTGQMDQAAIDALPVARENWQRASKAETLQGLVEKAKTNASLFNGSGFENSLRTQFRKLAGNDRAMARFSQAERDAIKRVATGGSPYSLNNTFRYLGKFSPQGFFPALAAAGATMTAGPVGMALPIVGAAGRGVATKMTRNAAQRAIDTAALGRALPRTPRGPAPLQLPSIQANSPIPYGILGTAYATGQ